MSSHEAVEAVRLALAAPFEQGEVKYKAQTVKGERALAVAYINARAVMDRLDDVFGVGGWQTSYRQAEGGVICTLRVLVGGKWITHEDIGGESEQPDEGDQQKAAFSDALKRAAVHLGIGRYLYRLKSQWVDYDPRTKQLRGVPAASAPAKKAGGPAGQQTPQQNPPQAPPLTPDQVKGEVDGWREWLDAGPDLDGFNETLKADLGALPREVKKPVWDMVCTHAQTMNWKLDQALKRFVEVKAA